MLRVNIKRSELPTGIVYQKSSEVGDVVSEEEREYCQGLQEAHFRRYLNALPFSDSEKRKILEEHSLEAKV